MNNVFTQDELTRLQDIIYKIGYLVSYADDTDEGEESENLERDHMIKAITRASRSDKIPVFVKDVAKACLAHQPQWDGHLIHDSDVYKELHECIVLIKKLQDKETTLAYKKMIMYVAVSVARAYREAQDDHENAFLLEEIIDNLMAMFNRIKSPEDFKNLNISPEEDTVLSRITEVMRHG